MHSLAKAACSIGSFPDFARKAHRSLETRLPSHYQVLSEPITNLVRPLKSYKASCIRQCDTIPLSCIVYSSAYHGKEIVSHGALYKRQSCNSKARTA